MNPPSLIARLVLLIFIITGFKANATDTIVTVRFANPEYVCSTQTYSLDVEFQSNINNTELFGMNVRFFYPDNLLEFVSFEEFSATYAPLNPYPPLISTGGPSSGTTLLGFPGPQEYINGAFQKISNSENIYLSTTGWTKLFSINFHVDDTNSINSANFCPSVIWDMNETATGGINPNGGIVMTMVRTYPNTGPAVENCLQFNWQYDGIPGLPHGYPVSTNCINTICAYAPKSNLPVFGNNAPGLIDIPVMVTDYDNITAFTIAFEYDPAVMTYLNNTPNPVFSPSNGLLYVTDEISTGEKKKIVLTFEGNTLSLEDSSNLAVLHFNHISGTTDLVWMTDGTSCEYIDIYGYPAYDNPSTNYYFNGNLVSLAAPVTKIDSITAFSGNYVTFTVKVWDYINIHSGQLTLNYDPQVLTFHDVVPASYIDSAFVHEIVTPGTLEVSWTGNEAFIPDENAMMYVTFLYQGGAATLSWYNNNASCQYINSILDSPLSDLPTEIFYANGQISNAVLVWTGENSSDWDTGSNWDDEATPNQFLDVIIDNASNPENWPTFYGNFILGEDCNNLTLNGNANMTIEGDLIINPGHTLNINGSGTLEVHGDWINSGCFIPGDGIVDFTGSGNALIMEGLPPGNFLANYELSTFPGTMVPLAGGSAGPSGNDNHLDVNIGFNFNYLGINYAQLRINTNGWISLNKTGDDLLSNDNTCLFNTDLPATTLAPWWDDLKTDEITTIKYQTTGTAPARKFTAEWKNILAYSSASDARLNFQVKLYENTNIIEFWYGNVIAGTHSPEESASIGLKDGTGGTGNFIEATQNSNTLIFVSLKSESDWPETNYRISPPDTTEMEVFNEIKVSKTEGTLSIQRDVKISGIE